MESNGVVLLIEDNKELNIANTRALKLKGYKVHVAASIEEAKECLGEEHPDVILLDVMLPDGDGFEFCREIRNELTSHIIFLTARAAQKDKLHGLLEGGDDYISKPFHPEEMIARVAAAMRRRSMKNAANKELTMMEWSILKIDLLKGIAFINDEEQHLTGKEFLLLLTLLKNRNRLVEKALLYEAVWRQPLIHDENALWKLISRLNKKLQASSDGRINIVSERKKGYSLVID